MADIVFSQIGLQSSETHKCPEMAIPPGPRINSCFVAKGRYNIERQISFSPESDSNPSKPGAKMAMRVGFRGNR